MKSLKDHAVSPNEFAQAVRQHRDIPLTEIGQYPHLAEALQAWQQSEGQRAPRQVDPLILPKVLLPYVMLLDLEDAPARLRVRLAGTYVCQKYGAELKGRTTDDFFSPTDARHVVDAAVKVAKHGIPSLAERTYVNLDGGLWSYVRLIAPLSRSGTRIDSFFKVLDPATLQNHTGEIAA
jgi:hypothetical protein